MNETSPLETKTLIGDLKLGLQAQDGNLTVGPSVAKKPEVWHPIIGYADRPFRGWYVSLKDIAHGDTVKVGTYERTVVQIDWAGDISQLPFMHAKLKSKATATIEVLPLTPKDKSIHACIRLSAPFVVGHTMRQQKDALTEVTQAVHTLVQWFDESRF